MNNKYNIIHFSIQKIKSQIIFNLHFNILKKIIIKICFIHYFRNNNIIVIFPFININ